MARDARDTAGRVDLRRELVTAACGLGAGAVALFAAVAASRGGAAAGSPVPDRT
jgi:hypothetical protein